MTFVPDLSAGGDAFKILIADPTLGTNILQADPDPDRTIGKPGAEGETTVQDALQDYAAANIGAYTTAMAAIKTTLMQELALGETAFVEVPAFFAYPGGETPDPGDDDYTQAYSLLPNLVNLLVVNGRLIVAEPFYDGFKTEFVSHLSGLGYQEGTSIRFMDDWEVYHDDIGEIHCGTSVKRIPSDVAWWTHDVDSSRTRDVENGELP